MLEGEVGRRRVAPLFGGAYKGELAGVLGVRLVVDVAVAGQAWNVGRLEAPAKASLLVPEMRMVSMTLLQRSRRASLCKASSSSRASIFDRM